MSTTTKNPGWGFYGTMGGHAEQAWPIAIEAIAMTTGQTEEDVGTFLDSTYGRHFADEVQDQLARGHSMAGAISVTANRWQTRPLNLATRRRTGILREASTLTALVADTAIAAEQNE